MQAGQFSKTMMIWWRFGQEHGEETFKVNPPEVVEAYIKRKVDRFKDTPEDIWRWWWVNEDLIVERWDDSPNHTGPDTRIYYLLNQGLAIIENIHLPPPDDRWKWYIHVADYEFSPRFSCWLMKDLFCDIMVEKDDRSYHIYDLPDLAQALDIGLLTSIQTKDILKRVDWAVQCIHTGCFPMYEVDRGREACSLLGW